MSRTKTSAILMATLALASSGPISPARAAEPEWNQKEVLRLADELGEVLHEAEAASRDAPPQATALQQRKRDAAANGFHRVQKAAADFSAKLRAGRDRELTQAYFRNVRDTFESTRKLAGDAVPTEKVKQHLTQADKLLEQLSHYYPEN
jgi:hypothetical protein